MKTLTKTDEQIVDDCNELAGIFAQMNGWRYPEGFRFYSAQCPRPQGFWNMAVAAYEHIEGTPVEDAVVNVDDDREVWESLANCGENI